MTLLLKALLAALLALAVTCGYLGVRLTVVKSERDSLQTTAAVCASANASNIQAISALQSKNAELVSKIAADLARSKDAADQYLKLEAQYDALQSANEALRDELIRTDPKAGEWLLAGMPASVACSVWKDPSCAHRGR